MPFHGVLVWNWMAGEELVLCPSGPESTVTLLCLLCRSDMRFFPPSSFRRTAFVTFPSSRHVMGTMPKDGREIYIYSLANSSSPVHVATPHLTRTTATASCSSRQQRQARPSCPLTCYSRILAANNPRVHVFAPHYNPVGNLGRCHSGWFVMYCRTLGKPKQ